MNYANLSCTRSLLKLHMHTMLLSTSFNQMETVLGNLYHGFTDVAERCMHYMVSLGTAKQPPHALVISKCISI